MPYYGLCGPTRVLAVLSLVRSRRPASSGVTSLAGIARILQARGVKTPAGRPEWQAVQVGRLLTA